MSVIYLASPYTHANGSVMEERYIKAVAFIAKSLKEYSHYTIYSPVTHYHPVAVHHSLPRDYAFWKQRNDDLISIAKELWVLTIDGWEESLGVRGEIEYAKSIHIPVRYVDAV